MKCHWVILDNIKYIYDLLIQPSSFHRTKIRLGEHEISNPGKDCDNKGICNAGSQDFDIEKIIIHPEYNSPNTFQNDIAIVKLDRKVSLNGQYLVLLYKVKYLK